MAVRVEQKMQVDAPRSVVWAYFSDPLRVAPCLPGASITEVVDARTYRGQVQVQIGPIAARYQGAMTVEEADEAAGLLVMRVHAAQIGMLGRVDGHISCRIDPTSDQQGPTDVTVLGELNVTGRIMQLAGGLIATAAKQVFEQFASCARNALSDPY
jgi:carbon monoxide dehydrogenase subunit G